MVSSLMSWVFWMRDLWGEMVKVEGKEQRELEIGGNVSKGSEDLKYRILKFRGDLSYLKSLL